jgi:capsular polysaccharide export protein
MNIAYLDPPYSRYFHRVAARLSTRTGGAVVALLSSPAYRIYTRGDRSLVWPPGVAVDPPPMPAGTQHATWSQQVDEEFRGLFWHAVAWLREQLLVQHIDVCLVFSDARPFSLAASIAARQLGVRCVYFERGAFRYSTASISELGLNARFSLREARKFVEVRGVPPDEPLHKRRLERGLKRHFARFLVSNALALAREPQRRRLQHKRYAFGPYLRLEIAQWWTEHHLNRQDDARLQLDHGGRILVVPLQLPSDSQMILHSPFESNQAFLDFVVGEAKAIDPRVHVLIKRHPMDSTRYRMPAGATLVGGNLARFFGRDPVVVCVNSTVGFEAAVRGLSVVCFGESFYTDPRYVFRATPENFAHVLTAALEGARDAEAGQELRASILRWYQAPGDAWAFTKEDLDRTADIVLQHCQAAARLLQEGTRSALNEALHAPF